MLPKDIWSLIARILLIVFLLPIHELAHGWLALKLGDPTAKKQGRLTLNPIKHLDLLGFFSMIIIGIGWAKPVPVDTRHFKNPRRDYALVAAAGPMSNFLLGFVLVGLGGLIAQIPVYSSGGVLFLRIVMTVFQSMAISSVYLGIFNLVPVPPLDGFNIIGMFFPKSVYEKLIAYSRYLVLVFFALILLGVLDYPLSFLAGGIYKGFLYFYSWFGLF